MGVRRVIKIFIISVFTLIPACSSQFTPAENPDLNKTLLPPPIPINTVDPLCLGAKTNPIGEAIAEEYETASYDQVMTWFCNGAEFEDILVALETEIQTDTAADEILQMLADGFLWEEIWVITGLTD